MFCPFCYLGRVNIRDQAIFSRLLPKPSQYPNLQLQVISFYATSTAFYIQIGSIPISTRVQAIYFQASSKAPYTLIPMCTTQVLTVSLQLAWSVCVRSPWGAGRSLTMVFSGESKFLCKKFFLKMFTFLSDFRLKVKKNI